MIDNVNNALGLLFDYWNGRITEEKFHKEMEKVAGKSKNGHGKCIAYKQSIFHDIYIYEDGYEEWVDIGD